MRRFKRYRDTSPPELNITAFMNLMVILVPFLLITAVFSRITILQLNLPEGSNPNLQNLKKEMNLEVQIRKDFLDIGTREGGRIRCVPATEEGHDYKKLSELIQQIKLRVPEKDNISLLSETDTSYEVLVRVMDSVRSTKQNRGLDTVDAELFPNISIGDAPPLNPAQQKAGCPG
jgi:biopolymer transport protein ExbD